MLARLRKTTKENEGGFTLIELLVVMIIIGILAAIAIPAFLNQKKKAAESSAKSDATNIARDVAAYFVDGIGATVKITLTDGDNSGGTGSKEYTVTNGTTSEDTKVKVGAKNKATLTHTAGATTYCVAVDPAEDGATTWSASEKGLFKSGNCT